VALRELMGVYEVDERFIVYFLLIFSLAPSVSPCWKAVMPTSSRRVQTFHSALVSLPRFHWRLPRG
jgi:hypothetical protein